MSTSPENPYRPTSVEGNARVLAGQWRMAGHSETLYTRGIGPCIGIAVYDPRIKIGHMAHVYSSYQSSEEVLEPMLDSILEINREPETLKGWLYGASGEASKDPLAEGTSPFRAEALHRLGRIGLNLGDENFKVYWNNKESTTLSMSLDCSSGELAAVARDMSMSMPRAA